jgi:hypothetical protein
VPDIRHARATLGIIEEIIRDPKQLVETAAAMKRDQALVPIESMWREYASIYRRLVPNGRSLMESRPNRTPGPTPNQTMDAAPSKSYVGYLAMRVAAAERNEISVREPRPDVIVELRLLRERLRSPRHRIAETLGTAIQKIPIVWPIVSRATEAVLRWEKRRSART